VIRLWYYSTIYLEPGNLEQIYLQITLTLTCVPRVQKVNLTCLRRRMESICQRETNQETPWSRVVLRIPAYKNDQLAEVGKVTFKSNGDEALNDEFLLKSNGDEALSDGFP
jgi:hypothetical protein